MKTSVLEFKLFDDLFCLNTSEIDYVFELEQYTPLKVFHESVIGIVKYNSDVMMLLDTATLYSNKNLDLSTPKSVIVIKDEDNNHFGLLVDEIIKIEDVEVAVTGVKLSTKETTINHYKAKDMIINEIDPIPLLKSYNIPSMSKSKRKKPDSQKETYRKDMDKDYLLFEIGYNLYAVESLHVREVIENSSELFLLNDKNRKIKGTIAIRDEIIKIADIDKPKKSEDIVVVEIGEKNFGIEVDEIRDIKSFDESKIEYVDDENFYLKAFYNYGDKVVAIINPHFFIQDALKNERENNQIEDEKEIEKFSFLIFKIQDTRFTISMESIRRVAETDTLPKTKSSSIVVGESVKFITTWNKNAVSILTLENIINVKPKESDTQAIFVEIEDKIAAFIVDDIDDIVLINRDKINKSEENNTKIINGAIIYNDIAIPTINEKTLLSLER